MPAYQPVSFQSPGFDYGADISGIERKRLMAQMLQKEGMIPIEQQPTQPGQFAVPISPFQGAAKMGQILAANMQQKKADKQQRELAQTSQSNLASVLMNAQKAAAGTPGTPMSEDASGNVTAAQPAVPGNMGQAAGIYMQDPRTMQLGAGMMQQDMQNQQRQRMLAEIMKPPAQNAAAGGSAPAYGSPGFAQAPPQNPLSGMSPQAIALMISGDSGLEKVGSAANTMAQTQGRVSYDQNGNAFTVDHSGRAIPLPGIQQRVKPEAVHLGGETQFVDPYKQAQPMPHTLTPQNRMENWWNMGIGSPNGQQPAAPGQAPAAPAPIAQTPRSPMSPLNVPPKEKAKLEAERPQQTLSANTTLNNLHNSITQIERLEQQPGLGAITGPVAGRTPNLTGGATNAQANLDTLKAQIGVHTLQAMRDASKTGGAVGQVTEKEWPILQNQLGALQQSQTTTEFKKNLVDVKETLKRVQGNVQKSYEMTYGKLGWKPPASVATPLTPSEQQELEQLRAQHGRR